MHLVYTAASASENSTSAAELRKWRAVITKIERTLTKGPNSCEPGTIRAGPIDAAQFEGSSFALVDVCPLGAYTELIDVMRFDANQPVLARSRRDGHQVAIGFSRGASVMHGKDLSWCQRSTRSMTFPGITTVWTAKEPLISKNAPSTLTFGAPRLEFSTTTRNSRIRPHGTIAKHWGSEAPAVCRLRRTGPSC
jgi:hypothetical protein